MTNEVENKETIATEIQNDAAEVETQEARGIKVKFEVNADESPILERLVDVYSTSNRGKMVLLKESVCGGFALKESGMLDLILAIAAREDYIAADSFGRTSIMMNCLREVMSPPQQIAFVQPPIMTTATPVAPPAPKARQKKAKVEKPAVEEPAVEEPVIEKPKKVEINDLDGLGDMGA